MDLKLIGEPNSSEAKTLVKIPLKEYNEQHWVAVWLVMKGAILNNPTKKNSRFIYFTVDGDLLNGPKVKEEKYGNRPNK